MSHDFWYCPICRGNYDHGEKCDCQMNEEDKFYENDAEKIEHPELPFVIVPEDCGTHTELYIKGEYE